MTYSPRNIDQEHKRGGARHVLRPEFVGESSVRPDEQSDPIESS
jgi:hypothetical protein